MGVVLKGCWRVDRWGDSARVVVDSARARAEVRERVGCIVVEVGVALSYVEFLDVRRSSHSDRKAPIMLTVPQSR